MDKNRRKISLFYILCVFRATCCDNKRILLGDPQYGVSLVHDLEVELQGLKSQLSQHIATTQQTIQELKQNISSQTTEIQGLKQNQTTEIQGLKQNQTTEIRELKQSQTTEIQGLKQNQTTEIRELKQSQTTEIQGLHSVVQQLSTNTGQDFLLEN